jgi:sensor domain CHASE-containing protein
MSFNRFAGKLAVVSFLGCLVVGLLLVGWRMKTRADALRTRVRIEAAAQATAVAAQLSHTLEAAETLGVVVRQSSGSVPNFAKVGTELLAVWPGLDSLELQPGGIVSDVVPRAGHERAIGFNTLSDPTIRAIANAAIQRRVSTVTGPLLFSNGELGIVARMPIFQRGRDGREIFWGFTAASMRLSQALARAGIVDLPKRGFDYICFAPATGQQQMVTISRQGPITVGDAVQQPVRVKNAEFRLGLRPHGGWVNKTKIALEAMAVVLVSVVVSGLTALLASVLENRQALEASLTETNQRLSRETTERQQAHDNLRTAKDAAAAALEQQVEFDQTRAALQQARQAIADLEARAQTAARAEKETAAGVLYRLQQDQATIADLQAQLDAATRSAREGAEGSLARIRALEAANDELTARLAQGEDNTSRVAELEGLLREARAEAVRQQDTLATRQSETDGVPAPKTESETQEVSPEIPTAPVATMEEPEPKPKAPRPAKRKKTRRDDQMDLFAVPVPEDKALSQPLVPTPMGRAEEPAASLPVGESMTVGEKSLPEPQPEQGGTVVVQDSSATVPKGAAIIDEEPRTDRESKDRSATWRRLAEDWAGSLERIRDDLVQGDSAAAQETVDALKTAASGAGAAEVEDAVVALASAIRNKAEPDRIEFLWADLQKALNDLKAADLKPATKAKDERPRPARSLPAPPPVNPGQLRKAVNLMVPLLTDGDPGAKDCLKDNRDTFRSTFTPEGYVEFEQSVKRGDSGVALEHLRKAVKKHGISA